MKSKKGSSSQSSKKSSKTGDRKRSAASNSPLAKKGKSRKGAPAKKPVASELDFWKKYWIPALIVTVMAFPMYWVSLSFDYVLDDSIVLSENRFVEQGFGGIGDILGKDTFLGYKPYEGNEGAVVGARYRPLSLITFAIETELFATSEEELAAKYSGDELVTKRIEAQDSREKTSHFINILLYALTGLLLFRVLSLIFPDKGKVSWALGLAFIATLLFMAHPLHVEAVANVKGRDEILALIFSLLTLFFSFKYILSNKLLPLILSGVMFYLGILAKENSITFFAVIPLAIFLFTKTSRKKLLMTLAPLGVVVILYLFQRYAVIGHFLGGGKPVVELMNNPFVEMSFMEKYAAISHTLYLYVKLLFFPHPLTHDYYPYQIPKGNWGNWQSILGVIIYLGMLGVAVWQWKKSKITTFSILFYILTLSIVSNIVFPIGTFMNDRFMYMPSVGFCLLLAYWLTRKVPELFKGKEQTVRYASVGLAGLIALGFMVKTYTRVPAWENAATLNAAAIKVSTQSARANQFYGYSLYVQSQSEPDATVKRGLIDTATVYVDRALEIYPGYTEALKCKAGLLGQYYNMDGQVQPLLDGFYKIIVVNPVPFTDTYLRWLNGRNRHAPELAAFYHKVGYEFFWQKQQNAAQAKKYLNFGKQVSPGNPQILQDLAAIP